MSYKVNTKVNLHRTPQENNGNMLTVLTFVDSKSNFSRQALQYIPGPRTFESYFSDKYTEYSETLKQAIRVLDFGYNLLTCNVRHCKHRESLRIFKKDDSYDSLWFSEEFPVETIHTTLHANTDLAVKFKLSDFTAGKYLLLEHVIEKRSANCYIGAYDNGTPLVNQINYAVGACHRFDGVDPDNPEASLELLKQLFSIQESYIFAYTDDGYVHIMYPYAFELASMTENLDLETNRIPVEKDDAFMYNYMNNVNYPNRVLDVVSRYNSDIEDLEIEFSKDINNIYSIDVHKYQNGSTIFDSENYSGTDLNELFQAVNGHSQYVEIHRYTEDFPIGKYRLKQLFPPENITYMDYVKAIQELHDYDDEGYCFNCNIILEPDLPDEPVDHCLEIQDAINDVFKNSGNMYIKFFNYLGKINTNLCCYFDPDRYLVQGNDLNVKNIVLRGLVNADKSISSSDILKLSPDRTEELPYAVNTPHVGFKYMDFPRIRLLFGKRMYDVYDMLVVSCVNSQVNTSGATKSEIFFYDLTETLTSYFKNHFGYDPDVSISGYSLNGDTVQVSIQYVPSDMSEVSTIDLLLDLYGE